MKAFIITIMVLIALISLLSTVRLKESLVLKLINDSMKLNSLTEIIPKLKEVSDFYIEYPHLVIFDVTGDNSFIKDVRHILNTSEESEIKERIAELVNEYLKKENE